MAIKFKIKELGSIRDSEIELKPFMIFSGNSNVGKSYTAFLCYYLFESLNSENLMRFVNVLDVERINGFLLNESRFEGYLNLKSLSSYLQENVDEYFSYLLNNEGFEANVEFQFEDVKLPLIISQRKPFEGSVSEDHEIIDNRLIFEVKIHQTKFSYTGEKFQDGIDLALSIGLKNYFFGKTFLKNFLLPPARGGIVDASYRLQKGLSRAGMYEEFLEQMDDVRAPRLPFQIREKEENFFIENQLNNIFNGKIISEKDSIHYTFDGKQIPLQAAASSIKELSPLFLILKKYIPQRLSLLIEEPEAHTHPEMQRKVARLLSYLVNEGAYLQITTHSDYFLNQINNLIKLHKLKQTDEEGYREILEKYKIDEASVLDPEKVGAYYFHRNEDGTVKVVRQKVEEGVPFDSFKDTVNNMVEESGEIDDLLA